MKVLVVLIVALGSAALPVRSQTVEAGNGQYRVLIDSWDIGPVGQRAGLFTTVTGPDHPVTAIINGPADILDADRTCRLCEPTSRQSFASIRSWSSHTDYPLGTNPFYTFPVSSFCSVVEPGFECFVASALTAPRVESVFVAGTAVGVRAEWEVHNASDDMHVELLVQAHGQDFMDSSVEVSIAVTNMGPDLLRLGFREAFVPRLRGPITPANPIGGYSASLNVTSRPPDEPPLTYQTDDTEWLDPQFRAWEAVAGPYFFDTYAIGGTVAGPPSLSPQPTPSDLLQYGAFNGAVSSGEDFVSSHCFSFRIPQPPRAIQRTGPHHFSMSHYWGLEEADAIEVPPGETRSVTQYLMAYDVYPLTVEAPEPSEVECTGAVVAVPMAGSFLARYPTAATIASAWSSADPGVSFSDASAASTEVLLSGIGTFPITFTSYVGPYQATAETSIRVIDDTPPRFVRLSASPSTLWPPNHRMVSVQVSAEVEDCDPAPTLRLVEVRSNETGGRRVVRGAGNTEVDVEDAELGTADMDVRVRAERAGPGVGRVYTLVYEVTDWAGNVTRESVEVSVPHDEGRPARRR